MERKQTENAVITAVDEAQGIVEAVWAVMGNIDDGNDIIHPGAFTKTFNERGNQIKLLDNHRASSVMDSLGIVQELKELRGSEMPQEILNRFPDATGGAWGKFKFLMDTPEGKGAFTRLKAGAVRGWSFGYDAVDKDHSTVAKDGKQVAVRNLRQIKLYEISPVLFAMNEATVTTGVKGKPSEGKPYGVVEEDGSYNVYKLDEDDKPTGQPLGEHEDEAEANAQVRALYAEEEDGKAMHDEEEDEDKSTEQAEEDKAGRVLSAQNIKRILTAMNSLHEALAAAGVQIADDGKSNDGPSNAHETPTFTDEAGPLEDEDTYLLKLIDIELEQMEV